MSDEKLGMKAVFFFTSIFNIYKKKTKKLKILQKK